MSFFLNQKVIDVDVVDVGISSVQHVNDGECWVFSPQLTTHLAMQMHEQQIVLWNNAVHVFRKNSRSLSFDTAINLASQTVIILLHECQTCKK